MTKNALPQGGSEWMRWVEGQLRILSRHNHPTASIASAPLSDAGFPVGATTITAETVIDRFTIAAEPYERRVVVSATCYTTVTVANTQVNLVIYANGVSFGYGRENIAAIGGTGSQMVSASGKTTLAANTALVVEVRIARQAGTGTVSTSISSGLFNTNVQLIRTS